MLRKYAVYLLGVSFLLSGCVVRSYPVTRDRVDQELTGNRGYLQGEAPTAGDRKPTRTTRVVEIELHPALTFDKGAKKVVAQTESAEYEESFGNRGYIEQGEASDIETPETAARDLSYEKYTVQKGDTLQKISRKLYGTTKKWNRIYEANRDALSSPDKIYPGQVIRVPAGSQGKFK